MLLIEALVWDVHAGKPVSELLGHKHNVQCVAFSPDAQVALTGSADATARLWNARTGEEIGEPMLHGSAVAAVAFSADGGGRLIGEPLGHEEDVLAVAFSPDGRTVLTGCSDKSARLWSAQSGKPLGPPLMHHEAVRAVAFSPDGRSACTVSSDHRIHRWRIDGAVLHHVSTRFYAGVALAAPHFLDKSGDRVRIADFLTGNQVIVREIRFDIPDAAPIDGDPARLLADWLDRAALKFARDGVTLISKWPAPSRPAE